MPARPPSSHSRDAAGGKKREPSYRPLSLPPQDSKISSLERGLRDMEEEILMLKSNGALSTEEREEEMKQMEVYRSHSKFMKNKVTRGYRHADADCSEA